jgi:hypothetical protein
MVIERGRLLKKLIRTFLPVIATGIFAIFLLTAEIHQGKAQIPVKRVQWQPPITVPSPVESSSWFPNLVVDRLGQVHIIWVETLRLDESDFLYESIYYTMRSGNQWAQFVDIAAPIRDIRRNSLTIDQNDILHMSFVDSFANNPYRLGYTTVPADQAFSANSWSQVVHINDRGQTYMNEIRVFENTIHALYEDSGPRGGSCSECADMFYRRSLNGGLDWDMPVAFLPSPVGAARPYLSIDEKGVIYASWDEGWDRHSGRGEPEYGVYTISRDLGETWSNPVEIHYPDKNNSQLTIQGDGQGGVMLVWRTTSPSYPGVYFQWSKDYGQSWTQPATLPAFISRPTINNFDSYAMATDSAGNIHLLATGFLLSGDERLGASPGLFHFEWDGVRWYPPTQVYNAGLIPEYPRLFIERGNQLHATWFVRHDAYADIIPHQIMYTRGVSAAPALEIASPETNSTILNEPEVMTNRPEATSEPLPTPTLDAAPVVPATPLFTENDEYLIFLISLIPVTVLLAIVIRVGSKKARRKRR